METSQLDPKHSLQPFDPEVFQRVWNRVMPDQDHSPIAMDAPAQPAVPALSPAPEQPPETPPEVPDRKSTRLNSSHHTKSRMPSSA